MATPDTPHLIMRAPKGLEGMIGIFVVDPLMREAAGPAAPSRPLAGQA